MTKPAVFSRRWNNAVWVLYFARGVLWGAWASQTPAIKQALHFSVSDVGTYSLMFSLGSIAAVFIGGRIIAKLGSRTFSIVAYTFAALGLVGLSLLLNGQNSTLVFAMIALLGFPVGNADLDNNLQASALNRASGRNLIPSLQGGFSVGVLVGSGFASLMFSNSIPTQAQLVIIAISVAVMAVVAAFFVPRSTGKSADVTLQIAEHGFEGKYDVWKETRTIKLAVIAFAFVFSEAVVTTWVPVALSQQGFSDSAAAFGYTVFGFGMAAMRIAGNKVADTFGRRKVVVSTAIVSIVGQVWFVFSPVIGGHYFAAFLWGAGAAISLAMVLAAAGDNAARMAKRVNMIMVVVYIANAVSGPIVSAVAQVTGLYGAFFAATAFMLAAIALSKTVVAERLPVNS